MATRGSGSIVNIGSLYASVSPDQRFYDHLPATPPFLKSPAYGASKAGVVNMTKYFSTLWGARGVRVNTLSPGGVLGGQDEQFKRKYARACPLGRMAQADDLKGPLVFLASPRVVVRDGPRAARRRRLHGVVTAPLSSTSVDACSFEPGRRRCDCPSLDGAHLHQDRSGHRHARCATWRGRVPRTSRRAVARREGRAAGVGGDDRRQARRHPAADRAC